MNAKAPDVGRLKVATVHLGYERPQVLGQKPASVSIEAQCESGPFDEQLLEAVEGDAQNGTRLSRTRRSGPFAAPEKGHFSERLATANRYDPQFFSGRHHISRSHLHDEQGVRLISLIEHNLALPVLSRRRNLDEAGDVCICGILEQVNAVEKSLSIHGYPLFMISVTANRRRGRDRAGRQSSVRPRGYGQATVVGRRAVGPRSRPRGNSPIPCRSVGARDGQRFAAIGLLPPARRELPGTSQSPRPRPPHRESRFALPSRIELRLGRSELS